MPNTTIRSVTGSTLATYLPSILRLHHEIFPEQPCDMHYAQKYLKCKEAILVIVFDSSMIVGASTGLPLEREEPSLQAPFIESGYDVAKCFFLGPSMLLPPYRGRGFSHHFFEIRETHAAAYHFLNLCFCCTHPEPFLKNSWRKRGYVPHPELNPSKEQTLWVKDLQTIRQTDGVALAKQGMQEQQLQP